MIGRLLHVEPTYGYGWSAVGVSGTRDTLTRVIGSVEDGWVGKVEMPTHEFDGQNIQLSARHVGFDGQVSVVLEGAMGWAVII